MTRRNVGWVILAAILTGACTSNLQVISDAGADGGTGHDSGPPGCKVDLDCAKFHTLCNVADGGCVLPPHPCDPNHGTTHGGSQCNGMASIANCYDANDPTTNFCFCRPDATADAGGYCYPQLKPCATCTTDLDCGAAGHGVDNVGVCTTLDAPSGTSVCLRYVVGGNCDGPTGGGFVPGQVVDGGALCECPNMMCPCGPCANDQDCSNPSLGVCARGVGTCQAPCAPPPLGATQCPSGQVCHVMDKYLDPNIPLEFYGGGRCDVPCAKDSDCQSPYYSQAGGVLLHCDATLHTCRPPQNWCVDDYECTLASHPDASVQPFCDIWAAGGNRCNGQDCRLGTNTHDMTMLQPFGDCLPTYACLLPDSGPPPSVPDASEPYGYGVCEIRPCYEIDPLFQYGCLNNEFCCGAGDAGSLNPSCTIGQCYCAPHPAWCQSCGANADCAAFTGLLPGPAICAQTFAGSKHCAMPCDKEQTWTCPAGAFCSSFGLPDNLSCPTGTTPAQFTDATTTLVYGCQCPTGMCSTPPVYNGAPMVWDPKLGMYVLSENCLIRDCGIDGGC